MALVKSDYYFFEQEKGEKIFFRFLEILPGFLSFGTLFFAFFFSFFKPFWVGIFIIIYSLYWCLRALYLMVLQIFCYQRVKKNLKINWGKIVKTIPGNEKIFHLVLLPVYREGPEIIKRTLRAILNAHFPKERIIVVISFEEKERIKNEQTLKIIKNEFSQSLPLLFFTFHTLQPDEIPGRGSNINWAIKVAQEQIIPKLNIPYENIICSNFDIDTVVFPEYFNIVTYYYLKSGDYKRAFQPIPVYVNNVFSISFLSFLAAFSATFWQMMQQEKGEGFATFSSHAVPLKVIQEIGGYPKNLVPDDSHLFWKSYLFYNGNFKVLPLYYPVAMDAVSGDSFFSSLKSLYKQQRRWAWGVVEFPIVVFHFLKNKKIPFFQKLCHSISLLEGFWSWATASLLIFFLGWLPLLIGGEDFNKTIFAFNVPRLTSSLMTLASVGFFVSAFISFSLVSLFVPKEKFSLGKKVKSFLQWFFLPAVLIIFGCLPALDAQLRLILKKDLVFQPTEKYA